MQVRGTRTQPWNKDFEGSGFIQDQCLYLYLSKFLDLKVVWVMRGRKRNNSQDGISIYILIWIWLMSRSAIWWRTWTRSIEDAADVFYCCRFFHFVSPTSSHRLVASAELQSLLLHIFILNQLCGKRKKHLQLSNCQYTAGTDETRPPAFVPNPGDDWRMIALYSDVLYMYHTNYGLMISSTFAPVNSSFNPENGDDIQSTWGFCWCQREQMPFPLNK